MPDQPEPTVLVEEIRDRLRGVQLTPEEADLLHQAIDLSDRRHRPNLIGYAVIDLNGLNEAIVDDLDEAHDNLAAVGRYSLLGVNNFVVARLTKES